MASNLLYLLFLVASAGSAIGALGYQFDIPDTLTNAKSPLDDSTAKFLKSLLEGGLVLNTPDVCHSLGFFCADEISSSSSEAPEVPKRSLGTRKLLNAAFESHPNWVSKQPYSVFAWTNEEQPSPTSNWVNKQPYSVFAWTNEEQPSKWFNKPTSSWVNKQPYSVFAWTNEEQPSKWFNKPTSNWVNKQPYSVFAWTNEDQPSKWFNKQPYSVFAWTNEDQPSKWFNKQPFGEHPKQKLESLPTKGRAFRFASAQAGKSILLPPITPLLSNKLIHPHLEDVLPFNKESLSQVLRAFNLSANSGMGQSMEFALDMGKSTNNGVEFRKSVATTKEMVDFVGGVLCKEKGDCHVKSIAQSFENKESKMVKVVDVELVSKDPVACHTVPFPYKVYVCHKIKDSPVYKVNMMVEGGKTLSTPFICHWDTSKFRTNHQAFEDLNMKPGQGEICHWLGYETIVW
uniref:Putative lyciumin peptide n=1 Tax=Selaginella uncinata TaxID=307165 RepID=A0A7S5FHM8_SELUN|nr:putative lyciumin precursor peptide [Selaginella uncinata]